VLHRDHTGALHFDPHRRHHGREQELHRLLKLQLEWQAFALMHCRSMFVHAPNTVVAPRRAPVPRPQCPTRTDGEHPKPRTPSFPLPTVTRAEPGLRAAVPTIAGRKRPRNTTMPEDNSTTSCRDFCLAGKLRRHRPSSTLPVVSSPQQPSTLRSTFLT
jgi:hypothetical protein